MNIKISSFFVLPILSKFNNCQVPFWIKGISVLIIISTEFIILLFLQDYK